MATIEYSNNTSITQSQFIDLLKRSGLAERRPVDHPETVTSMVRNADLTVTAWQGEQLVGVARSVTDFAYCCYLSDLAVDQRCQHGGIGKRLIAETRSALGPRCTLILLSAPAAVDYYPAIGFSHHPQAWILKADDPF
jgi:GNAT superfamily N-acetyltransferase